MTFPNRYPGRCGCGVAVAAGEGLAVKTPGGWRVACKACQRTIPEAVRAPEAPPPPAAPAGPPAIRASMDLAGGVILRPAAFLGGDLDAYRGAAAGATYDRERKVSVATIPTAAGIFARLDAAGFRVLADPDVIAAMQAWEAGQAAERAGAAARLTEVGERLAANGLSLFPFQVDGVTWLAPRAGAILADDMGLGKTIQALTAAPLGAPVLVICPAVAKGVWTREARRWRPDLTPILCSGRGSFRWPAAGEMVVINYDILPDPEDVPAADLFTRATCAAGTVLIADEAHAVKGSEKVMRVHRFRALARKVAEAGGKRWLLTGTPLLNRPSELWSLLTSAGVGVEAFGSWPKFKRAMGGRDGSFGTVWDGDIAHGVPDRIRSVMLRRIKTEVLDQLPAKTTEIIDVDLSPDDIKRLDQIAAEMKLAGIDIADAFRAAAENRSVAFEQVSRARAILATAKMAAAMDLIADIEEAGEPVVAFSAHRAPIDLLGKRDGWATITGDTPNDERTRIEEAFQRGELRGVAGTIKAAGVAITLTRASRAIFVDAEWTPGLNTQAEDRIYRIGQARSVEISYVRASHPLDERVYELLGIKRGIIARTVDAARTTGSPDHGSRSVVDILVKDDSAAAEQARRLKREEAAAALREWAADADRRRDARKAGDSAARRGYDIDAGAFATPPRAASTDVEIWAADALATLSAYDPDGAQHRNDVGFSAADSALGHRLAAGAAAGRLTDGEWSIAIEIAARYPRQVGPIPS